MIDPRGIDDEGRSRPPADPDGGLSPEATRRVLHDLRVHQIELELQNEELRRAQDELEVSRARYFDLYDLAPVGYVTLGETGLIEDANFTFAHLLRVARSALVEKAFTRFILPADQDVYYHHRRRLSETGERQVTELRMLRSGGDPCWVRIEATLSRNALGVAACRAVVSDITARRHAEETLRASEARHRILFEKSHDALMTLAPPDWQFTSGNSTTLTMFGARDEATFVARPPADYAPARQPDGVASVAKAAAMIEAALREGSHFYEWTYRRISGQEFPATVLLTRIEIDGQPLLQATVRDETEVKRLQARLGQADRLASMGTLAASVAHEINNPLAYVLYNIETLATDLPKVAEALVRVVATSRASKGEDTFTDTVGVDAARLAPLALRDLVERALHALEGTQRIKTITKAIGTFSRVESAERSRIDLNYAIECAVTMVQNDIRFKAQLLVDCAPLPAIWASEGKLSQVFLNLLINASQAIEDGDVERSCIEVRTWVEGDDVIAEVKDTGKGIAAENLERVFEPFFTTKPVGAGAGLGLAICRDIVTEFGGSIHAESEIDVGTRLVVRLPIRKGISATLRRPVAAEKPPITGVRGRVLVVDDERLIRKSMARILGVEHEVVTAGSVEEAQAILQKDETFDVILCDLMMPGLTGMDLHQWLTTSHPVLASRLVFVTGGVFSAKISEYLARAGTLRIEKPCETRELRQLVSARVAACRNPAEPVGQ